MRQEIITTSKEETIRFGQKLAARLSSGAVIALSGDLGAGKTTLTQGLLSGLGVAGPYTSPTFVIMKQYDISPEAHKGIRRAYHADAYRIGTQEMLSIGWEEWMEDPAGIVIAEWPERIADIIPESAISLSLQWLDETRRRIVIENGGGEM
ncbi:MAG: tRNA (adenosine(37)-N6)-threonylcarbamoyltransferase complex ATPase subunit type 1 TsaE [Candidatus Moranbacteria bacterium]|nr:tRNA (adenosine(37)-N6)-threonylcarbamoyltransferase complex ATPase subunit type 1 TsaE [Candidatus Moranbacteria bacterium]